MYETIKQNDPEYIASQQATAFAQPAAAAATPTAPAPVGSEMALQRLNEALGSDFETRYEPDTVASPFVQNALSSSRSKADDFIANMLKRGVLSETGRAGAAKTLDTQSSGVSSKLGGLSAALLAGDRANLTNRANEARTAAQGIRDDQAYDPSSVLGDLATLGQSQASTFGSRYNAALPPGDLFDTSGIAGAGGGVTSPQNVLYDPYAVEGGKLSTGLGDTTTAPAADKKRRTSVF